jgi:uncharacterized protein
MIGSGSKQQGQRLLEESEIVITAPATAYPQGRSLLRVILSALLTALALGAILSYILVSGSGRQFAFQQLQTFVTIFLGIFIEAVPFLLAGSIVSGFIAVFVRPDTLDHYLPKRALPAALSGAAMGLVFPVCECGVVPVTRRLYQKGLPLSIGIAFLLAAPVINPIVILSTYTAFGWGPILLGRIAISFIVAVAVGLLFHFANPKDVLLPKVYSEQAGCHNQTVTAVAGESRRKPISDRIRRSLITAGDDFLDMSRYLILGSMMAASMQTLIAQSVLFKIGQGPVASVLVMQALAFVLSICSTVDAFIALAFGSAFTTGSILAFLTFGPMVDIKSSLMFLGVFQRRIVLYLIMLPLLLTMWIGILWNLNVGG